MNSSTVRLIFHTYWSLSFAITDYAIDWDRKSSILATKRWTRRCTTKPAYKTCASARPSIATARFSWRTRTSASDLAFSYHTGERPRGVGPFGTSRWVRRILLAVYINRALCPSSGSAFRNSISKAKTLALKFAFCPHSRNFVNCVIPHHPSSHHPFFSSRDNVPLIARIIPKRRHNWRRVDQIQVQTFDLVAFSEVRQPREEFYLKSKIFPSRSHDFMIQDKPFNIRH